jgi:hypothetical protein
MASLRACKKTGCSSEQLLIKFTLWFGDEKKRISFFLAIPPIKQSVFFIEFTAYTNHIFGLFYFHDLYSSFVRKIAEAFIANAKTRRLAQLF